MPKNASQERLKTNLKININNGFLNSCHSHQQTRPPKVICNLPSCNTYQTIEENILKEIQSIRKPSNAPITAFGDKLSVDVIQQQY